MAFGRRIAADYAKFVLVDRERSVTMTEQPRARRKKWLPMKIEEVGKLIETLLGGQGKLSRANTDPGEPRKTKPSG